MRILILTYYFTPDIEPGAFRMQALVDALSEKIGGRGEVAVLSSNPNRHQLYSKETKQREKSGNVEIVRIPVRLHKGRFADQILSYQKYFFSCLKHASREKYDLVFASSSRLFTAYLGSRISKNQSIPFYMDIRDIFPDTMNEVLKNKFVKSLLIPVLTMIEGRTLKHVDHLNVVSGGFSDYYKCNYAGRITEYTNGVDEIFCSLSRGIDARPDKGEQILITYAGNLGDGQSLHEVIPQAARQLGGKYKFRVIGDGGKREALEKACADLDNVEIVRPMDREKLQEAYEQTDYLFLHLNDYRAFEKVLPSKIFEYAATNKPIIAGVAGYAEKFLRENVDDVIHFRPKDVNKMVRELKRHRICKVDRREFVSRYSRKKIMDDMADSVIRLIG